MWREKRTVYKPIALLAQVLATIHWKLVTNICSHVSEEFSSTSQKGIESTVGTFRSASLALIASLYCNYLLLTCLHFSCISGYSEHIYSMLWDTERLCAVTKSSYTRITIMPCFLLGQGPLYARLTLKLSSSQEQVGTSDVPVSISWALELQMPPLPFWMRCWGSSRGLHTYR